MNTSVKAVSAGLTFLQAAASAIPRTMGDRDRISAMYQAMRLAVKNRFAFDRDDAAELGQLGIETCVGVFRPLDFYLLACRSGGTYARMWEAHHKQKPWVATLAVFPDYGNTEEGHRTIFENNRIAESAGVLLPPSFANTEDGLATYQGNQVWWCTSMDNDVVTLCRYYVWEETEQRKHSTAPFVRVGRPARIRKLSREDWTRWNERLAQELIPVAAAA